MRVSARKTEATRLETSLPLILAVGLDHPLDWDDENLRVLQLDCKEEACELLQREPACAVVLGPRLETSAICEILSRDHIQPPNACSANIILGFGANLDLLQRFVDEDRLFYVSRGHLPDDQLHTLVLAGVQRFYSRLRAIEHGPYSMAAPADRVLEFCTRLSFQTDLATAADLLMEAIQILVNADRSHYLIYEEETEILWSARLGADAQDRNESPCAGLVGYAARTGRRIRLQRCDQDSRYDADTDDPGGASDARFLAEPMFGNDGSVIAVVSAARNGHGEPFNDDDLATFKLLTACAASAFSGLLLQRRIRSLVLEQVQPALGPAKVFRDEALQHYSAGQNEEGEILCGSPSWLKQTHWLIIGLLFVGFIWMALAQVHQKASGQAVVKALHKTTASAGSGGGIRSVLVGQGDYVRAGDLLVQFYDAAGATALERVKQEVRSPSDGVVSDIRVHAGQVVNSGDQIASIVDESGGFELVAFFPGYYAPRLHPGMRIILKVSGYPESHEAFVIDRVGAEIIGPHEAEQYAGKESAGAALQVSGPVVSVRARLTARAFQDGEDSYRFYDGMTGETEVSVHSESLLVYLFPSLKRIFRR